MKGGLVEDRARNDGGAVALVGEAQPVEPGGPSGVEVPLEADFVPSGPVVRPVDISLMVLLPMAPAGTDLRRVGLIER